MTDHLAPSLAAELILPRNYLGWAADVAPTSSKAFFGLEQPACVSEHTSIWQGHEINASQAPSRRQHIALGRRHGCKPLFAPVLLVHILAAQPPASRVHVMAKPRTILDLSQAWPDLLRPS
ncbi:hypothetical protein XANCAGTX0491_001513 [Xanthoria calcicola]